MDSSIKKLFGDSAVYGISTLLGRFINYLLVPFYTAVFLPPDYGIVTETYAYLAFLTILFSYGMETTFFYFSEKFSERKKEIYNTIQSLLIVSSLVFTALLFSLSMSIANIINGPELHRLVLWSGLILFTDTLVIIPFANLRRKNQPLKFAVLKLIGIIANVGLNLWLLYWLPLLTKNTSFDSSFLKIFTLYNPQHRVEYVFLANFLSNALFIPLLYKEFLPFRFSFNKDLIRIFFPYAIPILFTGLGGMVNEVLDRILLKNYLPDNFYPGINSHGAVGIYGACYKLSIFMSLGIQAYRFAAEPFFFAKAKDKDSSAFFAKSTHFFLLIGLVIFVVISLHLNELKIFLRNEEYYQGLIIVPVLLLGNLFLGLYYNLSIWFKLKEKTHIGTWITLIGAGLTLLLNFILIPIYGYMGSAITTLVCYFIMALVCYIWGRKDFKVPYLLKTGSLYLFVSLLFVYFIPVNGFLFRLGLSLFFILFIYVFEKYKIFQRITGEKII